MNNSMYRFARFLLAAAIVATPLAGAAQDLRNSLFSDTDALVKEAESVGAPLLSPSNYESAMDRYGRAAKMLEKNKSIESIRSELSKAEALLNESIERTELAKVSLAGLINARNAAVTAQADKFAAEEWAAAESAFESAAKGVEGGDMNRAKTRADKALPLYGEAELVAIEAAILNRARELMSVAKDNKIQKRAPKTMALAESLIADAESQLAANRYETAQPIKLAAQAEYEIQHATYLASQADRLKNKDVTAEELLLEWEKPLAEIARALETSDDFRKGYGVPVDAVMSRIALNDATIADRTDDVTMLTSRVTQLEDELGITTKRAEASDLRRQQVAALEAAFAPGEARILQEGGRIIVRLIGLKFATGEAVIESQFFGLLRKLEQAPDIFPGASLIVEGHTDAQGNDTMNLALSERRANSVRDYLLAATSLKTSRISAVGFGEAQPIANNETESGRAQNRRTDVIIVPAK